MGGPFSLHAHVGFNCFVQSLALVFVRYPSLGSLSLLVSAGSSRTHPSELGFVGAGWQVVLSISV